MEDNVFKTKDINLCIFLKCCGYRDSISLDDKGFATFLFSNINPVYLSEFLMGDVKVSLRQAIVKYRHVMSDLRALRFKAQKELEEANIAQIEKEG